MIYLLILTTYLFAELEGEGVVLLNQDRVTVNDCFRAKVRALLMHGSDLAFVNRRRAFQNDTSSRRYTPLGQTTRRWEMMSTHNLFFDIAQYRGATGSIIFLLRDHRESHSRDTTACEGPCANINCRSASTVKPRLRMPAEIVSVGSVR